jgi:ankyrin repeat protein
MKSTDSEAVELTAAIQTGNTEELMRLLAGDYDLANVRISDEKGCGRTALHIAVDWPGNFPNVAETIRILAEAGADVNAKFEGASHHQETPLHWAASSDDVEALDALLDAGADIEADGAVIGGLTPMADATAFAQWKAAARLLERGAKTTIGQSAALGLMDRLENYVSAGPSETDLGNAFWMACHGGRLPAAEYLFAHGADLNWIPTWETMTPLDTAVRSKAADVIEWLLSQNAKHAISVH